MRGRSGRCPACGAAIQVPAAESAEFDILSVDPFALGSNPLASAGADPLAVPAANPLAQPISAAAPATGSSNKWLIAGIAGGGGALVLIILVVVAVNSMGGGNQVAQTPSTTVPSSAPLPSAVPNSPPAPSASPSPTSTGPGTGGTSSPAATTPGTNTTSTQGSGASAALPPDSGKSSANSSEGDKSTAGSTKSATGSPADHSIVQLPAALQTWHGQNNVKLTGILNPGDSENPVAQLSWLTGLLPHLGYQKEYGRLKLDKSINETANLEVGAVVIPEFQSPLDDRERWEGYPFGGLALTHFAGMSGVEDARNVCAAQLPRSDPRAGIFGYDAVARPSEITDGTSQTVMVVGSGRLANPWLLGGGSTIRGARAPLFDRISGLGTKGLPAPGTLAVMADGSVRYIPTTVDPKVFRAMCTIHGAETIDLEGAAPSLPIETLK